MKNRVLLLGASAVAIAGIAWLATSRQSGDVEPGAAPPATRETAPPPPAVSAAVPTAPTPPAPMAPVAMPPPQSAAPQPPPSTEPSPVAEATQQVEGVRMMIRDFRTLFGENPVGTNAEIMKSVMGGNPKGANLGPPANMRLNDNGELLDEWGTPIFFHALSRTNMEIRSAGPDGIMWTGDDILMQ